MAKTVTFPAEYDDTVYPHIVQQFQARVAVRRNWGDDWVSMPYIYALEITWSVAPTLPVAVLEMDYGYIRESCRMTDSTGQEIQGFTEIAKTSATGLVGQYVRIQCETLYSENLTTADQVEHTRTWYGVIEEAHDEQGGVELSTGRCYGRVTLVAYGLEKMLADHQVLTSMCEGLTEIGVPLDFNRTGPKGIEGNRATHDIGVYSFSTTPSTTTTWSTRDIVNYLLTYQTPVDENGAAKLRWGLHGDSSIFVTDRDKPLLKSDNATTYSLLCQLLDRRRGLVWWCEVDDDDEDSIIWIKANSLVAANVEGNNLTLLQNGNQVNVLYDSDPLTHVIVNSSDLPRYHQVVARGPRIRCVGTFSAEDGTLEAGWKTEDEATYEAGGTPHPANTPLKRKQERNDVIRRQPKLSKVFAVFRVPESWRFTVRGGEPMFVNADGEQQDQNCQELCIEQSMPLLEGEDYEGTRVRAGLVAREMVNEREMKPLCFFRRPYKTMEPYKYQPIDGVAADLERTHTKENERLQCSLTIPQNTLTVCLTCQGEPQHAIAYADFQGLAGEDKKCGQFDWRQAVFTFSIESQFHTEARYPEPPASSDAVRRKFIYAGDQYYQNYVAAQTVVGLDSDGYLVTTDGGWIPTLGSPEDPLPILADIARISAAWYCVQHYVLRLSSYRLKPRIDLSLGSLILEAGGGVGEQDGHRLTVNSPITQIKFSYPRGSGDRTPPARMDIETWAGELDAVDFMALKPAADQVLRREAQVVKGKRGRK